MIKTVSEKIGKKKGSKVIKLVLCNQFICNTQFKKRSDDPIFYRLITQEGDPRESVLP